MKKIWDNVTTNIMDFKTELESLMDMVPKSPKFHKQSASINKSWKKIQMSLNELDKYISPVKSIEVKNPLLQDPAFRTAWDLWKEYLIEQHEIFMHSRAELMALKRMVDYTKNDVALAIYYLEYPMGRLEKNFYVVKEPRETKEIKSFDRPEGKKFVLKIPDKYKNLHADPQSGLVN